MDATPTRHDHEVLEFLADLTLDREAGRQRSLLDYLARYPGREEAVAREFLQLRARGSEVDEDGERDVGPYRLLAELGRGGQGAVWLARDRRLGREVALKVLHRGRGATSSPQRFRREALVAARLDDPRIATVFDAGEDGGRPWLAMRYVPGESLAALLSRQRATAAASGRCVRLPRLGGAADERAAIDAVVTFFARAARALGIAHDAGIVHRDVKPGNLMVTPSSTPVLVDFGLARDNDSSAACLTHTGEQLGTPAYMAPELLRPGAAGIGPEVDVWGLAVVLYEALTGSHPFAAATSEAMQSAIREREPTPLRRLNPAVPRSLATVVEVAMQKAPAGRHRNAAAFATDLELVANGEAPLCRPPGPLRRLGNAARRHPVASVAITLVITFATIAILYLDHAWRVESGLRMQVTAHAGKLRRLARELLFGAYETVRDLPGAIEVNRELATQALEYLQLLGAEAADDPGLRADVVMALLRVGDVLGNPRHANLGQSAAARSHYEEALALLSDAADPAVGRPRLLRANCLLRLGELAEGDHDAAAASRSWREALALLPVDTADGDVVELRATLELRCGEEAIWAGDGGGDRAAAVAALRAALELTESGAGNPRLARIAAAAHTALARLAIDSGDDAEATSAADAAAALLRQLPTGHEHHLSVRCLRAVIEGVRGTLEWHAGAAEDALRRLRATTAALAELGQLDPGNEQVARYRLQTCGVLSIVLIDQERHAECEELLQQAMRLVDDGAARFGADWFEEQRAATLTRLGQLRYNGQDLDQAEALMRQVVEVHRSRAAAHPGSRLIAGQLVLAELRLGWALVRSSQAEAGRETIVGAQAALTELLAADPTVVAWRKGLVTAHQQIAELAFQGNDFATANDGFAAAIAAQQQLPPGPETDRGLAILHQGRGESRLQLSRFTEACVDGETAVELLRRLGERAPQDRYVVRLLATALVTLARFRSFAKDATAQAAADEAFAVISRLEHEGGEAAPKLLQTRAMAEVMQALLHHYAGRRPEAAEALQAARRTVARMPGGQQRLNGTYGQMQKLLEDRYGLSGGR